ncbi:uncharacterized protein LOC111327336 [Stylophora pistillata]|uniref:uncharacterized protein LOC111327336 n=1 Tax=Stylophora pistillata TaxID=50429 RepID=UPI000C039820|nr:uncharacterized protein LOC111327336 [Stylophora pistillata]
MGEEDVEYFSVAVSLSFLSVLIVFGHTFMLTVLWKDPFKRFRTAATIFVFGMVFANLFSGLSAGPLLIIEISSRYGALDLSGKEILSNAGLFLFYWTTSVSYLSMLGLSLCQYVGVKMPHKQQGLVTIKTTGISLAIITCASLIIPSLLVMGVSASVVDKLQLHIAFQLSNFLLCTVYAALGRDYLRQVKRAMDCISSNASCVRVRDRNFTRANLLLLTTVTALGVPIMIAWHISMYGQRLLTTDKCLRTAWSITIIIFFLKITLDPLIYCLRLPIYRRALKRIFEFRQHRVSDG